MGLSGFWGTSRKKGARNGTATGESVINATTTDGGVINATTTDKGATNGTTTGGGGRGRIYRGAAVLIAVGILGLIVGFKLPRNKDEIAVREFLSKPEKVSGLPEVVLGDAEGEGESAGISGDAVGKTSRIRVLSANLIGIYDHGEKNRNSQTRDVGTNAINTTNIEATEGAEATEEGKEKTPTPAPGPRLAGIRILGEVRNVGKETVRGARVVVNFYDGNGRLKASKIGHWNESYRFVPLSAGETNVYDVLVAQPPSSSSVTLRFEADDSSADEDAEYSSELKIVERGISPVTIEQNGEEVTYYQFAGTLKNPGKSAVVEPGVYLWIKNEREKVIGLGSQRFAADLLAPEATVAARFAVVPVVREEMASYEIRVVGKKF